MNFHSGLSGKPVPQCTHTCTRACINFVRVYTYIYRRVARELRSGLERKCKTLVLIRRRVMHVGKNARERNNDSQARSERYGLRFLSPRYTARTLARSLACPIRQFRVERERERERARDTERGELSSILASSRIANKVVALSSLLIPGPLACSLVPSFSLSLLLFFSFFSERLFCTALSSLQGIA